MINKKDRTESFIELLITITISIEKIMYHLKQEEKALHWITNCSQYLEKPLNWTKISSNSRITEKITRDYSHLPWCFRGLSMNPNVSLSWIIKEQSKYISWDWTCLSQNPSVSLSWLDIFHEKSWDWTALSSHPNFTLDWIKHHPTKPWSWDELCRAPQFQLDWLEDEIMEYSIWSPYLVSTHPNCTWDEILHHSMIKQWMDRSETNTRLVYLGLVNNPSISWDGIQSILQSGYISRRELPWRQISASKEITWDIVREYPEYPWNWYGLSENPNITEEIIDEFYTKPWVWETLGQNPNLTLSFILTHLDQPWDWKYWVKTTYIWHFVSSHSSITPYEIITNPSLPWIWSKVSQNPNLSWDLIERYPTKSWDWDAVSRHSMDKWYENELVEIENRQQQRCQILRNDLLEQAWKPNRVSLWCLPYDTCCEWNV